MKIKSIVCLVTLVISSLFAVPQSQAVKSKFYVAKMKKAHLPTAPNNEPMITVVFS